MKPLRMCMVCRERREKQDLIRITRAKDGTVQLDPTGSLPGRGAYLCKQKVCISQAQRRKALERAFSGRMEPAVYDRLAQLAEVLQDES